MKDDCKYIFDFAEEIYGSIPQHGTRPRGALHELAKKALTVMAKTAYAAGEVDYFRQAYSDEIKFWGINS